MKPRILLWIIILLLVGAILVDVPKFPKITLPGTNYSFTFPSDRFPIKLGLDLQGGVELVYQANMDQIPEVEKDQTLNSVKGVIERRVNPTGTSEIVVQTAKVGGLRRIIVDLPGAKDASSAAELIGRTAQLEFKEMPTDLRPEATASGIPPIFLATPTGLTGSDLKQNGAKAEPDSRGGGWQVTLEFTSEGSKKFAEITKRNIGKQLPIFLDEQILSAPTVSQEIIGSAVITGSFTAQEAKDLAKLINGGALKVPIELIQSRSISASLGAESVKKSLVAGLIGLGIILIYMVAYYGFLGLVADAALIIYALLVLAIFKTGLFILPPVTLSLPGIAGFILSIGMAVDANILIFERMKEEKRWGKSPRSALELGFSRAWSSIRDSNISSLITASILYYFGTGLIKGFAVTLAIGVLVSMFTAVVVTRTFLRLLTRGAR
jgi:preprotein translocase subunit SecD